MNARDILIRLSLIEGVGIGSILRLLKNYSLQNEKERALFLDDNAKAIHQKSGISLEKATKIKTALFSPFLSDKIAHYLSNAEWKVFTLFEEHYPQLCKAAHSCYPVLWVRGSTDFTEKVAIAVVGSRKAQWYGKRITNHIVKELVSYDCAIVSGGAYGIDAYAHQAALESKGTTVVVAGSGLCHIYPRTHYRLFDQVVASGGCIISPFSPDTKPAQWTFPQRNYLIATLSAACVVVQAAVKSGALLTARYALEEGREVGAVPGPIDDNLCKGSNNLLLQGAIVVADGYSFLSHIAPTLVASKESTSPSLPSDNSVPCLEGSPLMQAIIDHLYAHPDTCFSADDLVLFLKIPYEEVSAALTHLLVEGHIEYTEQGLWRRP